MFSDANAQRLSENGNFLPSLYTFSTHEANDPNVSFLGVKISIFWTER